MTQQIEMRSDRPRLPIYTSAPQLDIEAQLREFEAEERRRLGLEPNEQWIETMARAGFTKAQRASTTLLVGGLTLAHDKLVTAALRGLGYEVLALDCPDNDALRVGKEFGNRGQCNPTYFTVGNLVKYLIYLRDVEGMTTQAIIDKFVFLTAGACGPCRFGMYVTEYRKALRDAGFEGFRVMLFQQQAGLKQASGEDSGLELTPKFFLALVRAFLAGDVLNALGYRIRPYEVDPGSTDRALQQCHAICTAALRERRSMLRALRRCRRLLGDVKVDRTQVKPKVAIIGEFWAMTTEGDGNYHLQRFIEQEGGEVEIQLITAWLLYTIWEIRFDTEQRVGLRGTDKSRSGLADLGQYGVFRRQASLWAAEKALRCVFQLYARSAGLDGYHLADMDEVAEVAKPFYNNDLRGGEGHMEVGKLILNVVKQKATMTVSVKPFGCMPSSGVSDGVQSVISERYPGTLFCAVETSGDGAVNFQSRVQMVLFKAKQAAQAEMERALGEAGLEAADLGRLLERVPRLASSLAVFGHRASVTSANLVYELGQRAKGARLSMKWGQAVLSRLGRTTERMATTLPRRVRPVEVAGAEPLAA